MSRLKNKKKFTFLKAVAPLFGASFEAERDVINLFKFQAQETGARTHQGTQSRSKTRTKPRRIDTTGAGGRTFPHSIVSIRPEINHSSAAGPYLWRVITGSGVIYAAGRSPAGRRVAILRPMIYRSSTRHLTFSITRRGGRTRRVNRIPALFFHLRPFARSAAQEYSSRAGSGRRRHRTPRSPVRREF